MVQQVLRMVVQRPRLRAPFANYVSQGASGGRRQVVGEHW